MPDLFTHTITTLPVAYMTRKHLPVLFVIIGATFPDIFSRTMMVLFSNHYQLFWFATALHTPAIVAITAYGVSLVFPEGERIQVFWSLILGSILHLSLDMLQKHYVGGYYWLFPLNYQSFEIPLFWSEGPIDLILQLFRFH